LESLDSKDFESAMNKTATNLMRMGTTNTSVKDESVIGGYIEFDSFSEIADSELGDSMNFAPQFRITGGLEVNVKDETGLDVIQEDEVWERRKTTKF
jgi:hypothetical protein